MPALIVVPAKPLARGKARLAGVLSTQERRTLILAMLSDVVCVAAATGDVWVVCSDPDAARAAEENGARPVPDATPDGGLNTSLAAATAAAAAAGYEGVLLLASDLPCVSEDDVRFILDAGPVAVAPSRDGTGTNALWRSPPDIIGTAFGENSRAAHEALARAAGAEPLIVRRAGLALDVDTPQDLPDALGAGAGRRTALAAGPIVRRLRISGRAV
jgi:2-phospho-L-lactate guanylyltransferase